MDRAGLDEFWGACGAAGPVRLVVEGPEGRGGPTVHALDRPFLVVGHSEAADLRLEHPDVSGRHAYLQVLGGRLFCVDLDSRAGLRWGDGRRPYGWLDGEQGVGIGPFRLRAVGAPTGEDRDPLAPGAAADEGPPGADWVLEFPGRAVEYPPWPLNRELVLVGRARQRCRVRLSGPEVSRYHCALVGTPRGVWAVDLLSRVGTRVNGASVRWSRLGEGDELRVGPHAIVLRRAGGAGVPALRGRAAAAPATREEGGPPESWAPEHAEMVEAMLLPLVEQFGRMQHQMFEQFQRSMLSVLQTFGAMHGDQMGLMREQLEQLRALVEDRPGASPGPAGESPSAGGPATGAIPPADGPATPDAASGPPVAGRIGPADAPARPGPRLPEGGELHSLLARRIADLQDEQQGGWQKVLRMLSRRGDGRHGS